MAFPARDRTPRFADRLNRAMVESASAKGAVPDLIRMMGTNRLSVTNLERTMARLAHLKMELTALVEHDGMDGYAVKEIGRPVTDDAKAMLAKIAAAQDAIKALLPADQQGFLQVIKLDFDGTFAWRSFSPNEMVAVKQSLQELIDLIE